MKIGKLEIVTIPSNGPLDESCFLVRGPYKSWENYDILIVNLWIGYQQYLNKITDYFHPHVRVVFIVFIYDINYNQVRECELFDIIRENYMLNFPDNSTQITRPSIRNKWDTYIIFKNNEITAIVGSRATWSEIKYISITEAPSKITLTAKTVHYVGRDKFVYFLTFLACIRRWRVPKPVSWMIINWWYFCS